MQCLKSWWAYFITKIKVCSNVQCVCYFQFYFCIIFDDTVKELMNGLDTTAFYLTAYITASLRLLCVAAGMHSHCSSLP